MKVIARCVAKMLTPYTLLLIHSAHPLDESAARKPSFQSTWLPKILSGAYRRIMSKPVAISSVPSSTDIGDIDAMPTPFDGISDDSRPATPVDGGPVNRKSRRAEAKKDKRKKL